MKKKTLEKSEMSPNPLVRVSWGSVAKHTFLNLFEGAAWSRLEAVVIVCGLVIGSGLMAFAYEDYKDFQGPIAPLESMNIDDGILSTARLNKTSYWRLTRSDGSPILLIPFDIAIDPQEITARHPRVTIRWMVLPSGKNWVGEAMLDGKTMVSYEISKKFYSMGRNWERKIRDGSLLLVTGLLLLALRLRRIRQLLMNVENKPKYSE